MRAGIAQPRIGVCGINPHAGENGLFGHGEEAGKIEPAVRSARERGRDVRGPLPADTLFYLAARGDYDSAGMGSADERSLVEALRQAVSLAPVS